MINQKEIGIIGSGISGLGAAKLALRNNLNFLSLIYFCTRAGFAAGVDPNLLSSERVP